MRAGVRRSALASIVAAGATFTALAACSAFSTGAGDGSGDLDGSADHEVADGREGDDAGQSGDAEPPNLIFGGDFELGCGACVGNNAYVAETTTNPHSGKQACSICTVQQGSSTNTGITCTVSIVLEAGARYRAEAWVRAPDGDAAAASGMGLQLMVNSPQQFALGTGPSPTSAWQSETAFLTVGQDGGTDLKVTTLATDGCYVVDDVSLSPL
jgi:hypothetical protein